MATKTKEQLCFEALKCLRLEVHKSIADDVEKCVRDYIFELQAPKCTACGRPMYSYCSVCNPPR